MERPLAGFVKFVFCRFAAGSVLEPFLFTLARVDSFLAGPLFLGAIKADDAQRTLTVI